MNDYKINAPHSHRRGTKYIKLEIQLYRWNKNKNRTDRIGNMQSLRIDLDECSTKTVKYVYDKFREFLAGKVEVFIP